MEKLDPDYVNYNTAAVKNEEEDKKENLEKIRRIIEDEYNREIKQHQEHVEEIELQICKARKMLHLLRYVLVSSFYKKKDLEFNGEEHANVDCEAVPDKQNRIHPALKKLLGTNFNNFDALNVKNKRKTQSRTPLDLEVPERKKLKVEAVNGLPMPPIENRIEFIRGRRKTKHRLIVGNVSKWMPSAEDDLLTHKWMVYIRGPKEKADVSDIIDKVVFYLHPSYKPHDVVEVCEAPFHLSRRGWGEFPVRVQIYFIVKLNKPIDVVHNIKLEKTFTGRQTLGNETVLDVLLYDDKTETVTQGEDSEHDYCGDVEVPVLDHSYALPVDYAGPLPVKIKIEQDENNELIHGLGRYIKEHCTVNNFVNLKRKDIKFNNTKVIVFGKKIEGSLITNLNKLIEIRSRAPDSDESNIRVVFPRNRFRNVGEALGFLFKKIPLCLNFGGNRCKKLYPFGAVSLKEYSSWNVGKQRSSEWTRARLIKRILIDAGVFGAQDWTTKGILMYGRSHEFTPFVSWGLFTRDSREKRAILGCFQGANAVRKKRKFEPEEAINVESLGDEAPVGRTTSFIDITDESTRHECTFVRQTALDAGVILKSEEIDEGVQVNGTELVMLEAVKCLAEQLIRRATNYTVCSNSKFSVITKEDVEVALTERREISKLMESFSIRNVWRM